MEQLDVRIVVNVKHTCTTLEKMRATPAETSKKKRVDSRYVARKNFCAQSEQVQITSYLRKGAQALKRAVEEP